MLNLSIGMTNFPLLLSFMVLLQTTNISITSPQSGEILRGPVEILGNMDIPGFSSAELAFSYVSNPADSWFSIQTFSQPMLNAPITTWDTTALTDGDYILHLRVFLQDGTSQDAAVPDLKIRNDVIPPTDTPVVEELPGLITTPIPVVTKEALAPAYSFPSSTPFPANPAEVTGPSIYSNFWGGALFVLALFVSLGIFLRYRSRA